MNNVKKRGRNGEISSDANEIIMPSFTRIESCAVYVYIHINVKRERERERERKKEKIGHEIFNGSCFQMSVDKVERKKRRRKKE